MSHPRANVITRAVGANFAAIDLDKVTERLRPGDRFLLCSDGLSKIVPESEITHLLAMDEVSPAERLIAAALDRHADDNITAVTIEILPDQAVFSATNPDARFRSPTNCENS